MPKKTKNRAVALDGKSRESQLTEEELAKLTIAIAHDDPGDLIGHTIARQIE